MEGNILFLFLLQLNDIIDVHSILKKYKEKGCEEYYPFPVLIYI